ncbi:RepB family protein (plasmid) [Lactococcus lactis]|uniref:RepB family protein n=1 Tax=Lactococcus lactis TaxID=1358 RepID=UPI001F5A3E80|nr:RepB family protein [Lactococcus lactis]UNO31388.1 RepB family protein [Lactococcus lactis]
MSKNVKTIKELADELGTNKTRISRIINKNSIPTQKIKNKIVLEDNSVSLIRQYFKNETQQQNETVSILRTELDKAHSHIEKLSNLLDQQQRLALQDKKLLEEYKAENDSLKALKKQMEALNDKIKGQEQLNNQVSKKWYQFWK